MVKLTRKPVGDAARLRLQAKASRYATLCAAGNTVPQSIKLAYRDSNVKKALAEESCGKCGYCESKVLDTQFGDVEHIHPKAIRPDLRLDYENLLLSCLRCNNSKNTRYSPAEHHIDPYRDDPAAHLLFAGPLVLERPGDNGLGRVTEYVFDLNRADLFESRRERLKAVAALAAVYAESNAGLRKDIARAALERESALCGEYSMTIRAYLRLAFPNDGF